MLRVLLTTAVICLCTSLCAATLTVTNLNDTGAGSLRRACSDAVSGDDIVFDAALAGTITFGSEIDLGTKELTITGNTSGSGTPAIELSGASVTRLINTEATLTLNYLRFAYGWALGSEGGAVRIAAGLLTCNGCTFTGCSAVRGGAIGTLTGATSTVVCTDCTFTSNSVNSSGEVQGGTIWASTVTCTNCRFLDGRAFSSSSHAYGGAVFADTVSCTGCTFTDNEAWANTGQNAWGGAIRAMLSVTCTACTFAGNRAVGGSIPDSARGGAVHCAGTATFSGSTFAANECSLGNFDREGGAIYGTDVVCTDSTFVGNVAIVGRCIFVTDTLLTTNSIFSNTFQVFAGPSLSSGGYNICAAAAGGVPWLNATGDQTGTDPMLGPLQDNGGPVHTMRPLPGSPAIDQGGGSTTTTDARGVARPFDFPAIANATGGDGRDIGAVEFTPNAPPVITTPASLFVVLDTPRVISSISITDPDAGSGELEVSLTATNGTLTLSGITGLTFTTGTGTGDAAVTFTGTLTDINGALDGMTFTPATGYLGAATLVIDVDDQGSTGDDGALTDDAVVSITVVPPGKIEVQHGTGPVANGGGIAVDLPAGRASALILSLQNTGTGDLTILGVSFSAATNASGAVSTMPATVIAMGDSSQLVVAITPTATGAYSIDVQIESSDATDSPYIISISGNAFTPTGGSKKKDESCSTAESRSPALVLLAFLLLATAVRRRAARL